MRDFSKLILHILLMLLCMLSLSLQAKPKEQDQYTQRHFQKKKIEEYQHDKEFSYDVNPYRINTINEKIKYYLSQLIKRLFSEKGAAPYIRTLILLAILIFVVIKLFEGQFQWFLGNGSQNKMGTVILPDEETGKVNLQNLADKALKEGNLRMGIRYHYLYILKELDEKNFIQFHKNKTNRDYLQEIQSANIRSQFQIQTMVFDYVWYGNFHLSNDQFQRVLAGFQNMIESIQNAKRGSVNE